MGAANVRSAAVARLAIELMLAAFAAWLVLQNTLLLALDPLAVRPPAWVAAAALVKALGLVALAVWPWAVAAAAGFALCAGLLAVGLLARRRAGGAV